MNNSAETEIRPSLVADAQGNRWIDTAAALAFVNAYPLGGNTFIPLFANRATIFDVTSITSFAGFLGGASNSTNNPVTATTAVYPITATGSAWYGCFDGTFSKVVRLQFVRTGSNFEIHVDATRFVSGNQLSDIANAANWSAPGAVADSPTAPGYGLGGVTLGVTGQGFVTTWPEQSTSNHAFQTVANRQPRIVVNGVLETENTRPAVRFDNQWMFSGPAPFLTAAPITVIQVIRWIALSSYRSSAGVGNSSATGAGVDIGIGGAGNNLYVGAANIAGNGGSVVPTNQAVLITATHSGTASGGRINGADSPGTALNFAYNAAQGHMTLGSSRATITISAGSGSFRLLETLFVQGILSATQRQRLEASLAAAFGITIT